MFVLKVFSVIFATKVVLEHMQTQEGGNSVIRDTLE